MNGSKKPDSGNYVGGSTARNAAQPVPIPQLQLVANQTVAGQGDGTVSFVVRPVRASSERVCSRCGRPKKVCNKESREGQPCPDCKHKYADPRHKERCNCSVFRNSRPGKLFFGKLARGSSKGGVPDVVDWSEITVQMQQMFTSKETMMVPVNIDRKLMNREVVLPAAILNTLHELQYKWGRHIKTQWENVRHRQLVALQVAVRPLCKGYNCPRWREYLTIDLNCYEQASLEAAQICDGQFEFGANYVLEDELTLNLESTKADVGNVLDFSAQSSTLHNVVLHNRVMEWMMYHYPRFAKVYCGVIKREQNRDQNAFRFTWDMFGAHAPVVTEPATPPPHIANGLEHFLEGSDDVESVQIHVVEHDECVSCKATQTDGPDSATDAPDAQVLLGEFTDLVAQLEDVETEGKFAQLETAERQTALRRPRDVLDASLASAKKRRLFSSV
eukprot:TRINITY_DN11045_c0_g1_i1.p1 TRINITY_DN11045_c0_g1~~TRINITY_DN11045_c0_g1_i1.p1  ORF type:complete len:445 (+),score=53.20 TRINITY_DN11045_c0_g1_i1:229-1563(+)